MRGIASRKHVSANEQRQPLQEMNTNTAFSLGEQKVTKGMRKALERLQNQLKCPLCQDVFCRPTTLASCGHSFCEACIDDYNRNDSICPVQGCGMPMSIVGGRRGSFRNVNPQLAQTVESLQLICQGLNQAPDGWWKDETLKITQPLEASQEAGQESSDDENSQGSEDLIDLQNLGGTGH